MNVAAESRGKLPRLQLADDAVVLGTEYGLVIGDEFGTQVLEGRELGALAAQVLPLVDGTRSWQAITQAVAPVLAEPASAVLELLDKRGVLRKVEVRNSQWEPQMQALSLLGAAASSGRPFDAAEVTVYGLEPWGVEAARQLAKAGVQRLLLIEPGQQSTQRLGDGTEAHSVAARLSAEAPWCEVLATSVDDLPAHHANTPTRQRLLIAALRSSAIPQFLTVSRLAHAAELPHLFGTLRGVESIIGPLVLPTQSACWNCWRLRETACASQPWAERLVQATWESRTVYPRGSVRDLGPMSAAVGSHLALAALAFLAGIDPEGAGRLRVHNFMTSVTAEHRVIRMPRCKLCGGATTPPSGDREDPPREPLDAAKARRLYACWADARVGVVRDVKVKRSDICPTLVRAYATLSAYTEDHALQSGHRPYTGPVEGCGGKGFTVDDAWAGALGESVERYSAAVPPRKVRTARILDLEGDVLDPCSLVLYAEHQYARPDFPYRPYDPRAPRSWVQGEWFDRAGPVWLPTDLVYYISPGAEALAQVTSNGLAAGHGWEDAAYRATLELVERDAFLTMWLTRSTPTRLNVASAPSSSTDRVATIIRDLEAHHLTLQFYLLPASGDVPVVLCLGLSDGERWPAVTVATAADLDPHRAVEKAALEQAYTALSLSEAIKAGRRLPSRDDEVVTFLDHALLYAHPGAQHRLSFITQSAKVARLRDLPIPTPASATPLAQLAARLHTPVAIADVTASDVAATGARVVRALAPGLQPLHCGAGLERLANPRLLRATGDLHTAPHPMC